VHWAGSFWRWDNGHYHLMANSDVQNFIICQMDSDYHSVRKSHVGDVAMHLQTIVASPQLAPCWLGDEHPDWHTREVIATPNAITHLPSLMLGRSAIEDASPTMFNTCSLGVTWSDTDPGCPQWNQFLYQVLDNDSQSTLQQMFGYYLTSDTSLQKIAMLIGPPRSGKGPEAVKAP